MGYFSFQHNADSADIITHLLQEFLCCLDKGKNWTEFGLISALAPWLGKMALRHSAEITSLIPFMTLKKHIPQSWPDTLPVITKPLTVSPGARPSALGDTAHGNHSDAYIQYFAMSSITSFHTEKHSVMQSQMFWFIPQYPKTMATLQNIYWCPQSSSI